MRVLSKFGLQRVLWLKLGAHELLYWTSRGWFINSHQLTRVRTFRGGIAVGRSLNGLYTGVES